MLCMMAASWSKVPSALVRLARLGKSMLMPESFTTGVAEAMRARATVTREALQNMAKRASSSEKRDDLWSWRAGVNLLKKSSGEVTHYIPARNPRQVIERE